MIIGKRDVRRDVLIIAELGNNHEGDVGRAHEMVHSAADAGADAVKVQTFRTESYVRKSDSERFARLKRFEIGPDATAKLAGAAKGRGLIFMATPFDLDSAEILEPLVDAYKIASADADFFPLLRLVAKTSKPVVASTGGGDLDRVDRAVAVFRDEWGEQTLDDRLALLHCVSAYPTPDDQANLTAIRTLAERYQVTVGYSDHTLGILASITAVAIGARIIEKHFTLDKALSSFRDHQLSANPVEFAELVRGVRAVPAMLGDGDKKVQPCEHDHVIAAARSIAAARDLRTGHVLSFADLAWLRPAGGLPPEAEHQVTGRALARDIAAGELIQMADLD